MKSGHWVNNDGKEIRSYDKILDADLIVQTLMLKGYLVKGIKILELGFGYNRLLKSLKKFLDRFEYTGIDINPKLVNEAQLEYPEHRFLVKDILKDEIKADNIDFIISLVTFKHLYPDFGCCLKNITGNFKLLGFDLPLIHYAKFVQPEVLNFDTYYNKSYSVPEVEGILRREKYEIVDCFPIIHSLELIKEERKDFKTRFPIIRDFFIVKRR